MDYNLSCLAAFFKQASAFHIVNTLAEINVTQFSAKSNLRIDSNLSSLSIKQEIFHRQDNGPFYLKRMARFLRIKGSLWGGISGCAFPEITEAKLLITFQDPACVLVNGWNSGKQTCVGKGEKGAFQGRKISCLSLRKVGFVTVIGNPKANGKKKRK